MNDIRKGIPYIPSDPGFYREDGPVDWLRTQEGVWLHSTFPFNTRWTLDASRMSPRPFMRRLTPIGFGDLDQYGGVSGDVGFWFDDRGPLLWLRTIEGIWLLTSSPAFRRGRKSTSRPCTYLRPFVPASFMRPKGRQAKANKGKAIGQLFTNPAWTHSAFPRGRGRPAAVSRKGETQ